MNKSILILLYFVKTNLKFRRINTVLHSWYVQTELNTVLTKN